ncbi:maleylpyruvate isomerase family mycothiol-dependent enzyme [Streptacidiphilus sp. ASG 303]|uniref:maleylpyruvate isomerase family mycothiol-dependent enzyme n=1 Tax=Streptacidiphilus sp. ASG 303 TaxID=2896847 RepID=UPI001E4B6587|nr:maleylpyruvate isomerase family mycothiol-dependent enzyme [Streptacidiphilus sp. ASG 303]MCD0485861.1 maleylpyruvate isomerase family mycothiol-dependent enzyme [Streptacidiphilus sp. ASG 303]
MHPVDLLAHLRRELAAFRACLDGDLAAPVAHCAPWTLHDLAEHLGRSNQWATAAVTEKHGDHQAPPAPRDPAALTRWFDRTSADLLHALDTDPAAEAWTFHPPRTVAFWQRRRALEALIHRWDAEQALGRPHPLDPALADEGVAEVLDTLAPRQAARGRTHAPRTAIRLHATDTGTTRTHGPGHPVAELSATAEDLLLALWKRIPLDAPALTWDGDPAAGRALLTHPLTP